MGDLHEAYRWVLGLNVLEGSVRVSKSDSASANTFFIFRDVLSKLAMA